MNMCVEGGRRREEAAKKREEQWQKLVSWLLQKMNATSLAQWEGGTKRGLQKSKRRQTFWRATRGRGSFKAKT